MRLDTGTRTGTLGGGKLPFWDFCNAVKKTRRKNTMVRSMVQVMTLGSSGYPPVTMSTKKVAKSDESLKRKNLAFLRGFDDLKVF